MKKAKAQKRTRERYEDIAEQEQKRPPNSASARSLAILAAVSASQGSVSSVELSEQLGLSNATVHRLMQLLERLGYLQREPGSKRFIVGQRQTEVAITTLINSPQHAARHRILRALVDEVQETCNITTCKSTMLLQTPFGGKALTRLVAISLFRRMV